MKKRLSNLFWVSSSGNRKSAIQNLKWLGFFAIVVALTVCGAIAEAQQAKKIPRIAFLSSDYRTPGHASPRAEGIKRQLREIGYVEGQNFIAEYRTVGRNVNRGLAAELSRLKVDIIVVTGGTVYVQAVKNAITTLPIVMAGPGADPVEEGVIQSLARPGGNVTGVTNLARDLGGKRLELLKETVPKLSRVAILHDPTNQSHIYEMKEILSLAARALKLTLQSWEITTSEDFEKAFAGIRKQSTDGLYNLGGPLMIANQKRITAFALKHRLPSISGGIGDIDTGTLMYYGADFEDSYRQVAWYIDKILKGAKPADLPVQQPTKFEFVINLKTAKQIGLEIPQWTLMKADRVIK